jgi:hypothetical protein
MAALPLDYRDSDRVRWIDVAQCKPSQLSEKLPLSLPNYPKKVPTAGCG